MINDTTYTLPITNYYKNETDKKRIVIGSSFSIDMQHYNGWLTRYNGKYKKTAAYTIDISGNIHQHFNPKYYCEIIGNSEFDESTILILIENEGWLVKDLNDENKYITYVGNIYKRADEVFVKKWRHNNYWAPYKEEQLNSLIYLINELCGQFNIPKNVMVHNTKVYNGYSYEGILYKSNLNKYFTDVNPSWDFLKIKDNVEINVD
jgi:N-acetyl-anhydromuramyl-L-alanine amidase AmpD